jgi:hypothetical protein
VGVGSIFASGAELLLVLLSLERVICSDSPPGSKPGGSLDLHIPATNDDWLVSPAPFR